jgi:hypothetical protein
MPKSIWKRNELEIITANFETKTTDELVEMLPGRSRKAINRKIEKLREKGKVGLRDDSTIRRAYYQRVRGKDKIGDDSGRRRLPTDDSFESVGAGEEGSEYGYEEVS